MMTKAVHYTQPYNPCSFLDPFTPIGCNREWQDILWKGRTLHAAHPTGKAGHSMGKAEHPSGKAEH